MSKILPLIYYLSRAMSALQRDNDDDDDGGGGGGGDIAARWPGCQLLLSKLLFISCLSMWKFTS